VRKSKGVPSTLATLNAVGGKGSFVVNLHKDIVVAAVPNRILIA
jgi:hypothetical protein